MFNTGLFHLGFDLWVWMADLFCQTYISKDSALSAGCGSCSLILKCMSKSLCVVTYESSADTVQFLDIDL